MNQTVDEKEVVAANRRFYDAIAPYYDSIDSRRAGAGTQEWLDKLLGEVARDTERRTGRAATQLRFLDAGAGSGFLSRHAVAHFRDVTLVDVSQAMLDRITLPTVKKIQGDCCGTNLPAESFEVIGAFATLHHLFDPAVFFREAFRLLTSGGMLYTDHDISEEFIGTFELPLRVYRFFFDHGHSYLKVCKEATESDYRLSEFHGDNGLNGSVISGALRAAGFREVTCSYHWEGMGLPGSLVDRAGLSNALSRKRYAPVIRIVAIK